MHNPQKIEAVIFDWAGTTVDYGSMAPVQAFIDAFQEFGITPTTDEVRGPMGIAKIDHVRAMLQMDRVRVQWQQLYRHTPTEADVYAIYERSEQRILELLPNYAAPKPHTLEAVRALREMGVKIGSTTGYNDAMMEIVTAEAARRGYAPDACFTPDSTDHAGRPYPFMIFRNMIALRVSSVAAVLKVGDTAADIREGQNAGVATVGILEGSSVLGCSEAEFNALSEDAKAQAKIRAAQVYQSCGADYILDNLSGLPALIHRLQR